MNISAYARLYVTYDQYVFLLDTRFTNEEQPTLFQHIVSNPLKMTKCTCQDSFVSYHSSLTISPA